MQSEADASEAARRWAEVWKSAWEAKDTEAIVALYHPDVVFSTQPFRDPYLRRTGVREYVSQAFAVATGSGLCALAVCGATYRRLPR